VLCVSALNDRGIRPSDITHVVCSHGHGDHVGNLNLFPDALLIVSFDISRRDTYYDSPLYVVYYSSIHSFKNKTRYIIESLLQMLKNMFVKPPTSGT